MEVAALLCCLKLHTEKCTPFKDTAGCECGHLPTPRGPPQGRAPDPERRSESANLTLEQPLLCLLVNVK